MREDAAGLYYASTYTDELRDDPETDLPPGESTKPRSFREDWDPSQPLLRSGVSASALRNIRRRAPVEELKSIPDIGFGASARAAVTRAYQGVKAALPPLQSHRAKGPGTDNNSHQQR